MYDTSAGFWGSLSWSSMYEMVSEFREDDGDDFFFEVIPCRLNGPTATLPGTSGMFLSADVSFLVKSAVTTSHSSSHVHNAFGN